MKRFLLTAAIAGALTIGLLAQSPPKEVETKPAPKTPSVDQIIATAVINDADVKIAEAEVQLASAKLAAAKMTAMQKVLRTRDAIDKAKQDTKALAMVIDIHKGQLNEEKKLVDLLRNGGTSSAELLVASRKINETRLLLEQAASAQESALIQAARLEAEWKKLTESAPQTTTTVYGTLMDSNKLSLNTANSSFTPIAGTTMNTIHRSSAAPAATPAAGGVLEGLRKALDKPVKTEFKDVEVKAAIESLMKAGGSPGLVRMPSLLDPALFKDVPRITVPSTEMPLGSWLQLVADELTDNSLVASSPRIDFYVRDYGLLLATKNNVSSTATPLATFWKTPLPESPKK